MDNVNIGKLVMVSFLYHHAFAVMCIFVRELKIKSVHKYVSEFEENIFFSSDESILYCRMREINVVAFYKSTYIIDKF